MPPVKKTPMIMPDTLSQDCVRILGVMSERKSVVLTQLPMPPSSNNQYALIRRGSKILHVPSKELSQFKRKIEKYPLTCASEFMAAKHFVSGWAKDGHHLEFRCVFFFHYSRLFTKEGRVKRLDASNRIKALHDSLSDLFGIDDSIIFKVYAEKALCHDDLDEQCCIEVLPCGEE